MINTSRIQELREEVGEDDLAEVISLFCEEMDEVMDGLENTAPDQLPSRLHFLKGSALNIGLDDVSELCRIEELRLSTDSKGAVDIAAIKSAYAKAKQVLISLG